MTDTFKQLVANQLEASLCALNACIDPCPDSAWTERSKDDAFCRVIFHTLFYTDFYLGKDEESLRGQPFHLDNPGFFRDYEELEDREAVLPYDKPGIRKYLRFCRDKARSVIASETAGTLAGGSGFERRTFTRAELYVYNIRHVQHHAAQLSERLQLEGGKPVPWIGSGWKER
ncbi:MAG: DinB family protein [Spirochaetes bacterium]|nr:DinB family protein [Spirochaetota bacterium]